MGVGGVNDKWGIFWTIVVGLFIVNLAGCGASQKQLRQIDGILEQAKSADCNTIKAVLAGIQQEIQKKIDK